MGHTLSLQQASDNQASLSEGEAHGSIVSSASCQVVLLDLKTL